MTTQLPSRERLETLIRAIECESYDEEEIVSWVNSDEILSMARALLAAYEQEPYGYVHQAIYESTGSCALTNDHEAYRGTNGSHISLYTRPAPSIPAPQGDFDFERYNDIVWLDAVASQPAVHGVTAATVATLAIELNRRLDAAVLSIPAVPDGYALVPLKPTKEMLTAAEYDRGADWQDAVDIWDSMCRAAMLNGGKS